MDERLIDHMTDERLLDPVDERSIDHVVDKRLVYPVDERSIDHVVDERLVSHMVDLGLGKRSMGQVVGQCSLALEVGWRSMDQVVQGGSCDVEALELS